MIQFASKHNTTISILYKIHYKTKDRIPCMIDNLFTQNWRWNWRWRRRRRCRRRRWRWRRKCGGESGAGAGSRDRVAAAMAAAVGCEGRYERRGGAGGGSLRIDPTPRRSSGPPRCSRSQQHLGLKLLKRSSSDAVPERRRKQQKQLKHAR